MNVRTYVRTIVSTYLYNRTVGPEQILHNPPFDFHNIYYGNEMSNR